MDGMNRLGNKPFCYYIPSIPNGESQGRPGHYFPGIVVPDEAGYYVTDWDWGTDRETAEQCCTELNAKLGLTDTQVMHMVLQSMNVSRRGEA